MFANNKNKMKKQTKRKRLNSIDKLVALNEEELIQQVAMRPVLYDRSLKAYRKTTLRQQCWTQISEAMDAPVEECRRRWRSLRDSFAKHYKLAQRSEDPEQGKKHRKWIFYDKMKFIIPFLDGVSYELDKILDELGDISEDGQSINCEPVDMNAANSSLEQTEPSASNSKSPEELVENHNSNNDVQHSSVSVQATDFMSISMETSEQQTQQLNHTNMETNASRGPHFGRQQQQHNCNNHHHMSNGETNTETTCGLRFDSDEKFLLSCAPTLRRLTNRKNALARLKIQQILFDIEFQQENN